MKKFHIIEAKYIGMTTTKPARIRLYSARFHQTIFISRNTWDSGVDWLKANGFNVIGAGFTKGNVIIVTDTFKPLKPVKSYPG